MNAVVVEYTVLGSWCRNGIVGNVVVVDRKTKSPRSQVLINVDTFFDGILEVGDEEIAFRCRNARGTLEECEKTVS